MPIYSNEDVLRLAGENDVKFIRLQFTDIFGTLKNVAITIDQLEKALRNDCMFDGSSIEGFVRIEESDMYLRPDPNTFALFPWRPQAGRVARLICDIYTTDGQPFEGDPRYVLKRSLQKATEMGYSFNEGPECEFFLFQFDENGNPTTVTQADASYFDLAPSTWGRTPGATCAWRWRKWALRSRPATMRWPGASTRLISSTTTPCAPLTTS